MKHLATRATLITALLAGAIGGAAATRLWPAPSPAFADQQMLTSITAKQFQVMDEQGNVRVKLNVTGDNMAHLGLYDQQGVERASLAVTKEGTTMLAMAGDDGNPRLTVNLAAHGGPAAFTLLNPDGSTAAQLKTDQQRRSLVLADAKGGPRAVLQTDLSAKGESALVIYEANGKPLKRFP